MEIFFFRAISFFIHNIEEFYNNYRLLIYEIFLKDKDTLKQFYETDSNNHINLEDNINDYIENIKKEGTYSGDIKINKTAEMLQINII